MPIKTFCKAILFAAISVFAAEQEFATPYDLIRPVWPLTWDSTIFSTNFQAGKSKVNIPKLHTPDAYAPNEIIPDTLNQAYWDAMLIQMSPIRVNQVGYRPQDVEKTILYIGDATKFDVINTKGDVVGTGDFTETVSNRVSSSLEIKASNNATIVNNGDTRYTCSKEGPSGAMKKGFLPNGLPENERLRVKVGNDISSTFIISDQVYSMVRDAVLKFYGINRSGNSESWFHPASHTKDGSLANTDLTGGWYDCGDHLKESQTMSYSLGQLALMAAIFEDRDMDHYAFNQSDIINIDGIPDMLREAKFGSEFVIKAYDFANGKVSAMPLSIGDFGKDHGWWGRPEIQDNTVHDRGGASSRILKSDDNDEGDGDGITRSTVAGNFAAGLALVSKLYAKYDSAYSLKALEVAKALYDYGKKQVTAGTPIPNTPAYNGNSTYIDELAFAAICLFYATGDKQYFNEVLEDKTLAGSQTKEEFINSDKKGAGMFRGGWFAHKQAAFHKDNAASDWASVFTSALYALYKLILQTSDKANAYGISEEQRMIYIEDLAFDLAENIGGVMGIMGDKQITLPGGQAAWAGATAGYDAVWGITHAVKEEWWTKYEAANISELLVYYDVTKDLENVMMPQTGKIQEWKSQEILDLGLSHMNYFFGMNPWDVSLIYGIGDKNHSHPHHRASNPEGKNVPGTPYSYRPPVGGLGPGKYPTADMNNLSVHFSDYQLTENTCIDAVSNFLPGVVILSKSEDLNRAPGIQVEIRHVSMDSAIVTVKLDISGNVDINYSTEDKLSSPIVATLGKSQIQHEIILRDLKPGTTYFFNVVGKNSRSGNTSTKYMVDSTQTPYSFTTLNMIDAADIQNITVCNVHADSAEIMWYTPNGEYESKIYWDTVPHTNANEYAFNSGAKNADVSGIPTRFHYVKIGGLKEQTTYYYMVESNGMQVNVDRETNQPLKFKTPVTQYDFSVKAYQYEWAGKPAINLNIYNNENRPFDSLTVRMYMRGGDDLYDDVAIRTDICQAYDEAGFNGPCDEATLAALNEGFRSAVPTKIEDTYDALSNTWQWYFPIPLGSTVIKSASRFRIDVLFVAKLYNDIGNGQKKQDPLDIPPHNKKFYCRSSIDNYWHWVTDLTSQEKLTENPGDWSWMPHSTANAEDLDYSGLPCEDKDAGDIDSEIAPINPYVSVYRKDEFVWGYSPSRGEMETKRANYKIDVSLDAPFDVPSGAHIEMDQTSSTVMVTGHAHITEGGYITKIWANGQLVSGSSIIYDNEKIIRNKEENDFVAQYNIATGLWDLKIPVKMAVGSNKVDITIFAGPNPECIECTLNGGCAFENRSYYVQFTRGNLTPSALTIKDDAGNPIASPATPGSTKFNISVRDLDKNKYTGKIYAYVINSKKSDTLKVELVADANNPGNFHSAQSISAINKSKETRNAVTEISFFPGDTIQVIYIDPDDEEDISKQSFFAESHNPVPQKVLAQDANCDGFPDQLLISFSNAIEDVFTFDSIRFYIEGMLDTATIKINPLDYIGKSEITIVLNGILVANTPNPSGKAILSITSEGVTNYESISITDGILPTLNSVTILENPNHESELDTVMIAFSEPVIIMNESTWPLSTSGETGTITVVGKPITLNDGLSWQYVISGNNNGKVVPVGGIASIDPGITITDKALNALIPGGGCKPSVIIAETPKPVPVTLAQMRDIEGDGYPDEIYIKFKKHLRPKDMLDSFVVDWGRPSIIKSFITKFDSSSGRIEPLDKFWTIVDSISEPKIVNIKEDSSATIIDTVSILIIKIPVAMSYPLGTTSGAYESESGYFGSIVPRLGPEGGFFDKSYPVADMCPPIIIKAVKKTIDEHGKLNVTYSEPLTDLKIETLHYIERKRGSTEGVFLYPETATNTDSESSFIYKNENSDAVNIGDFVRLDPNAATSRFKDKAGNYPTTNNPWVMVTGSNSEKVKFKVTMEQSITQVKQGMAFYTPETQPRENEVFRLTLISNNGTESIVNENTFDTPLDPSYTHGGPVFKLDISMAAAMIGGKTQKYLYDMNISFDVNLFDNLGQFISNKTFKINFAENPQWREAISEDGILHLNLEWLTHEGTAPISDKGRKLGTGAYIAKFDFSAIKICTEDIEETDEDSIKCKVGQKDKSTDNTTKTFGFKRFKIK